MRKGASRIMITVFTPIYNRANIIGDLFKSLKRQSNKDFEWLIIDDGSTDNIKQVVENFQSQNESFEIHFISKPNGGKHTCINMGTELAKGEMFFIVDSDDYITDDAIDKIYKMRDDIDQNGGGVPYCGVAGLRIKKDGALMGSTFKDKTYVDATSLERAKFNINGDKAEVFFTDILRKYKFPTFDGENFVTENVVWLQMARDGYKIRWYNEPIYVCEYLEGGLTDLNKKNLLKNFYGDIYTNNLYIKLYGYPLLMRIRIYGCAYEKYKIDKDFKKLKYILDTFGIKKPTLRTSYAIYIIYKKFKNILRRSK